MAGASSIALAAVVVTLSTPVVQADARLSRPAASHGPPILSATPAQLAPPITAPQTDQRGTPKNESKNESKNEPKNEPKNESKNEHGRRAAILHGLASWYGGVFNGRKTASGERFDMYGLTACHATLPFGSIVRVINRRNKRSVVVRITDRGDLIDEGRIIDLSYGAAEKLAMTNSGLAKVDLQVISLGRSHGGD